MKIKIEELKEKKAVLKIEDVKPYFINSIRRILLSELPKLAVEDVVIYDNTSPLFDEIIAHRLGLIPIPTDLSLLNFRDKCVCKGEGCPNCTVRYTLSKEGEGMVYSGDLEPEDKKWAIKEDKIPIVELFGDQRLILEVEAILGRGKEHAKWQPVQAPGYMAIPHIEFDEKKIDEVKDFVKTLPEGIVEFKNDKLEFIDIKKTPVFESYLDEKGIDFIKVKRDYTKFIFSFETDGSLTAKDALTESAKILENKYKEFSEKLKTLK